MTNTSGNAITIDLYSDWIEILKDLLRKGGYTVALKAAPLDVAAKYFNAKLRTISSTPRVVYRAKNLAIDPKWKNALDEIERKAACGEPLLPHLSKKLLASDYNDPLLNDWGFHHLHLSTKLGPGGFIERAGPLLFARVLPDALYMVAVLAQGAWTNRLLLEEMLLNWPQLLAPYELKGVAGVVHHPTEKEHAQLRKGNVQTIVQLSDKKVYMSIGGGVATTGSNIRITRAHDRWAYYLRDIETMIKANVATMPSSLPAGVKFGVPPKFKLALDANYVPVVIETVSGCAFRINAKEPL